MKYTTKPLIVDAIQRTDSEGNLQDIKKFLREFNVDSFANYTEGHKYLILRPHEYDSVILLLDHWLVRNQYGKFYTFTDDEFKAKYIAGE